MLRIIGLALLALVLVVLAALCGLAIWFQGPGPEAFRYGLIAIWLAILVVAFAAARRSFVWGALTAVVALGAFLVWWGTILPSNDRVWQPDVARQVTGAYDLADPSLVTLRDMRDFDWRTPEDFTEGWVDRTYDLDELTGVDLLLSNWSGPNIAHTMLSFGFADGRHVAFSIETRKEVGEFIRRSRGSSKKNSS